MSAQFLLISVAVTCVSVALMFFYFKNRLGKTEQKVDLMFQLIQEHEKNSRYLQQNHQQVNTPKMEQQPELINISDDESVDDYASDDSAEVSDNEQEELVLKHDIENLEDTVKTISLSLNGAETSLNMETSESHQDSTDNTNEVVDDSNDESDNGSDDVVDDANDESNDEEKEDDLDIELDDDVDEQTIVDNTITLDHFIITKKDVNDANSDKSDDKSEKPNNVENEDQQDEENEDKKPSYTKLTKAQLKKIAEQRGLNGYNKLTKNGLVNLLAESD